MFHILIIHLGQEWSPLLRVWSAFGDFKSSIQEHSLYWWRINIHNHLDSWGNENGVTFFRHCVVNTLPIRCIRSVKRDGDMFTSGSWMIWLRLKDLPGTMTFTVAVICFVNGGNNSISNAILEGASSDALARDPVKAISQVLPCLKTAFLTHIGLPRTRLKLSDQSDAPC